jgi:NADPH2:quinone reductase
MRALRVDQQPVYAARVVNMDEPELQADEVLIETQYSSLNYKDALAITGKGAILKSFPLIPGIDAAGLVRRSTAPQFRVGDSVLMTGCGLGESYNGGYSEFLRAPAEFVIPCPAALPPRAAMILGTAGFTAALCLQRMEQMGQTPSHGPIVVTGASGGVGSFATALFAERGYSVLAVSSKRQCHPWLRSLGATEVCSFDELQLGARPLERARFGGAVDNTGGQHLAQLLAHTHLWGNVASVGLANSANLSTTVMPFILRGVSLLGISSNNCPADLRRSIWQNLACDWKIKNLEQFVHATIQLEDLPLQAQKMLDRQTQGRTLVEITKRDSP